MKTITLALQKGGVGKTTSSVILAAELSKQGKTLLIDADPQGNATTWILGKSLKYEFADVLNEKQNVKDVLQTTCIKNLYILPTAGVGGSLREYKDSKASSSPYAILDAIEPIKEFFDYCVIDTSPNFDPLNESVFMASDEIIAVLKLDEFSKDGLIIFTTNLASARKRHRYPDNKAILNKIIINGLDERIKNQKNNIATLQQLKDSGYSLFVIPVDQAFDKAQTNHSNFNETIKPKKETKQAFKDLAKAVTNGNN